MCAELGQKMLRVCRLGRVGCRRYASSSSSDRLYRWTTLGLRTLAVKSAVVIGASILFSPIGYSFYLDHKRNKNVDNAFNNGVGAVYQEMEIERDDVLKVLSSSLNPSDRKF